MKRYMVFRINEPSVTDVEYIHTYVGEKPSLQKIIDTHGSGEYRIIERAVGRYTPPSWKRILWWVGITIISVLLAALLSSKAFSQSLDMSYAKEIPQHDEQAMFYTKTIIGLPILFHKTVLVTPYAAWQTFAKHESLFGASPMREIYSMGVRVEYLSFYFDFSHYCDHPVAYMYNDKKYNWYIDEDRFDYWDQGTYAQFGFKKTFNTIELF